MTEAVFFWSSGKDSAAALHTVRNELDIRALVTTVNSPAGHVAVHRVPEALLDAQAVAIRLPLVKIVIPSPCPNEEYERRVLEALAPYRDQGVKDVVFGDINLADIRAYRESLLGRIGMHGVYPLWERDTAELARQQIDSGIRAVVTCVDTRALPRELAGREFGSTFIEALPENADPCGENGEFHTFVYNAPVFCDPVPYRLVDSRDEGQFSYAVIESAA